MTTFNDTPANVAALSSGIGLVAAVAARWLRCEGQEVANPTNPLNIRYYPGHADAGMIEGPGATGAAGVGFASFGTALQGISYAVGLVTAWAPYHATIAAIRAHPADPYAQARAIELSPWAGGHYGATGTRDGCVSSPFHVAPPGPTPPQPTRVYVVRSGDTLSGIAAKLGVRGGWPTLYAYDGNRATIGRNPDLIRPGQRLAIPPRR